MRVSLAGEDGPRTRLLVDGGNGTVVLLEEWMSRVATDFRGLAADVDELRRQSAEIRQELSTIITAFNDERHWVRSLPRESADFRQRLEELDQRLNNVLDLFEKHFGGSGQTEQAMLHHEYAAEYLALVEQKILALALDVLADGPALPRDKAALVAAVCLDLFGYPEIQEQRLMDRLQHNRSVNVTRRIEEICSDARLLRQKASLGRQQRWDFGYTRGLPVDEERQEMWPGSVDGGLVDFVVAPAYLVDSDTLLKKQRVFTATTDAEGAREHAGGAGEHPDWQSSAAGAGRAVQDLP